MFYGYQPCRILNYSPVRGYISVHDFGVLHSQLAHSYLELYMHTPLLRHTPFMQGPSTSERRVWRSWDAGVKAPGSTINGFLPRSRYSAVAYTGSPLHAWRSVAHRQTQPGQPMPRDDAALGP